MDMIKELSTCSLDELLTYIQILNEELMNEEVSLEEYIPRKNSLDDAISNLVAKGELIKGA
jgi:hypothetical protein